MIDDRFPRMKDLPEPDRTRFSDWLDRFGQTRPLVSYDDEYFPWDYDRWVQGGKP